MSDGLTITKAEYDAHMARYRGVGVATLESSGYMPRERPLVGNPPPPRYGVAPNGRPYKSKWEAEYGFWLATLLGVDAIAWWSYECFKLRLADGAYFTPDFPVLTSHGDLVMREVKGHWREAARLRVKVAASQFPWLRIEIISKQKGQWVNVETFNA